jgi:hypothetical protein
MVYAISRCKSIADEALLNIVHSWCFAVYVPPPESLASMLGALIGAEDKRGFFLLHCYVQNAIA